MKKIYGLFIFVICLFLMSCDEQEEKHVHTSSDWIITIEATCEHEGVRVKKCTECEEEIAREKIEKIDHLLDSESKQEIVNGFINIYKECSVCFEKIIIESIDTSSYVLLDDSYDVALKAGYSGSSGEWKELIKEIDEIYIKDVVMLENNIYIILLNDEKVFICESVLNGDLVFINNTSGVIVDGSLKDKKDGESFTYINDKTYVMGEGIFSSLSDALNSQSEGEKIVINLVSGVYKENITIKNSGVTIQGPNLGINPTGNLERYKEAEFNGMITILEEVDDITIKGIKFIGESQIVGNKGVSGTAINININHSNFIFSYNIVDIELNKEVDGFICFKEANNSYSENIKILNSTFTMNENTKAKNLILIDNNLNLEVKNNIFKDIEVKVFYGYDTTKGCSGSRMHITGNVFENIKSSAIYINWFGPSLGVVDSEFYIDENIFKNVGMTENDYAINLASVNQGDVVKKVSISRNEFENCSTCINIGRCHTNCIAVLDGNIFKTLPKYYYVVCKNSGTNSDIKASVLVVNSEFLEGYYDRYFFGDVTVE